MANTDPFSSSVIPFEVPEQMRAFAEKGVSQARDNYAKFKDAAETHNGTIEAVFTASSKGASAVLTSNTAIVGSGLAEVSATANGTAGAYTIVASSGASTAVAKSFHSSCLRYA